MNNVKAVQKKYRDRNERNESTSILITAVVLKLELCLPEIEARPDMESDKKLDKLESFLGRLNSKGKYIRGDFDLSLGIYFILKAFLVPVPQKYQHLTRQCYLQRICIDCILIILNWGFFQWQVCRKPL